jgi:hypothetical protein
VASWRSPLFGSSSATCCIRSSFPQCRGFIGTALGSAYDQVAPTDRSWGSGPPVARDALESRGDLIRVSDVIDWEYEAAALTRQTSDVSGPALLFARLRY